MQLKVAIIIERANIVLGGAERSVLELAHTLETSGLKVDIIAARGQATATNVHILFEGDPRKRTCYFAFAKALKKFLDENHYDIVHSVLPFGFADIYQPRGGTYAESVVRNAASYDNKFITAYKKATAFANYRRSILLRAEKKLCKDPDGPTIVALSQYVAKQFEQHYGLDSSRVTVISNGVKPHGPIDSREIDQLRTQITAKLNIKQTDQPVFFLFAANNFRLKGLAALIRAMALAGREQTSQAAYLLIAGRAAADKYQRLARELGIDKRIFFFGDLSHIQNALAAADIAVLPTFYDPSSRFILEALLAKKPVITTKFNGASDMFVNDRHGKVIESPGNISQLAEAINYFTDTNKIQKASQAIVDDNLDENVSIDRVAKQLISLYNSVNKASESG